MKCDCGHNRTIAVPAGLHFSYNGPKDADLLCHPFVMLAGKIHLVVICIIPFYLITVSAFLKHPPLSASISLPMTLLLVKFLCSLL